MTLDEIKNQVSPGLSFGDDVHSYHFKRIFSSLDVKARINDYFIAKIDNKIIPWCANWCQPWPVHYLNREPFRGINFFTLRSNYSGFCPFWLPGSYIIENDIRPKKGEKSAPVLLKQNGIFYIEPFYNLDQLQDIKKPVIKPPLKPELKEIIPRVSEFFRDTIKDAEFNFKIADFDGQDPDFYYYHLFLYYCFSWYRHTYKQELSFKPGQHNKESLTYRIGAAFLAAWCPISTPFYSINGYDRNLWKMLLMSDKNIIFEATAIVLIMFDTFCEAQALRKVS